MTQPVALVTGASSGIGSATARMLIDEGFTVFGTSRNPGRRSAEQHEVPLVALDVRSDDSVGICVAEVLTQTGRIDVLINNAGYVLLGEAEGTTLSQAHQQLETNFFGATRLITAVLPHMRERGFGRIVNVGSLAGLTGIPFMSLYSASKFALEGYSEALRLEVAPFGIAVSIVEPGFVSTPIAKGAKIAAGTLGDYDLSRGGAMDAIMSRISAGLPPQRVAQTILRAVTATNPRLRYRVGRDGVWLPRVRTVLPARRYESGTRKMFRLDTGPHTAHVSS